MTHPTPPPVEALPYSEAEVAKCRSARHLLPEPGAEVAGRLLATVDALAERCRGVEGVAIEDVRLLLSLIPPWATVAPPNLCPTFYGTGSQAGDQAVVDRVERIRALSRAALPAHDAPPLTGGEVVA